MAETNITIKTILWVSAGSFLPALFWLWFWLREDKKRPEPTGLLTLTFIAGIVAVFLVLPLEWLAYDLFKDTPLLITLAVIEELIKYAALYAIALRSRYFDEPIDAMIYAITVALGFSAMENFLYIANIIKESGAVIGALNGNLRFVGATLLHLVSSAAVGVAIAFSFYKTRAQKMSFLFLGLTTASLLHISFNLSIIKTESIGEILTIFFYLWICIVVLMFLFEKIKRIRPTEQKR